MRMCLTHVDRGAEARDELAQRYGHNQKELVDAFGSARDDWIETDFQGWLGANKFYEVRPTWVCVRDWWICGGSSSACTPECRLRYSFSTHKIVC